MLLNDAQRFGRVSEAEAARYLQRAGYRIVARNYRTRFGEIDLVAYDAAVLAFVEVKARRSDRFGPPQSAVTHDKQRRLTRAALAYLAGLRPLKRTAGAAGRSNLPTCRFDLPSCRFDLIVIEPAAADDPRSFRIELLKNAFAPDWDGA
jgi:putative endonuclease